MVLKFRKFRGRANTITKPSTIIAGRDLSKYFPPEVFHKPKSPTIITGCNISNLHPCSKECFFQRSKFRETALRNNHQCQNRSVHQNAIFKKHVSPQFKYENQQVTCQNINVFKWMKKEGSGAYHPNTVGSQVHQSAGAAITRYCGLGGVNNGNAFPHRSGDWKCKINRYHQGWCLVRALPLGRRQVPSLCGLMGPLPCSLVESE